MKKALCLICLLFLVGCSNTQMIKNDVAEDDEMTWQDYYDLGVRYLSEGNYEEAIIAFTAAIEIDPKKAEAYVGRGKAYFGSGESMEKLAAAQSDYEKAIELDNTIPEAYLGLADIYIRQGSYGQALDILKDALVRIGANQQVSDKISEIDAIEGTAYQEGNDVANELIAQNASEGFMMSYTSFSELGDDDRSYVENALQCVINGDTDGIYDIAVGLQGSNYYTTILDGYKISVLYDDDVYESPEYEAYSYFEIQVRSENDDGRYCRVDIWDGHVASTYSERRVSCDSCSFSCKDWQIEGEYSMLINIENERKYDDGAEKSEYSKREIHGTVTQNVLHGTVTENLAETVCDYPEEYRATHVYVYNNGELVSEDGEATNRQGIYGFIQQAPYNDMKHFDLTWRW